MSPGTASVPRVICTGVFMRVLMVIWLLLLSELGRSATCDHALRKRPVAIILEAINAVQ